MTNTSALAHAVWPPLQRPDPCRSPGEDLRGAETKLKIAMQQKQKEIEALEVKGKGTMRTFWLERRAYGVGHHLHGLSDHLGVGTVKRESRA